MITRTGRHLAFLIGPPRSGTTLLSVLLGRSPQAYCPPELWLALPATRLGRTRVALHGEDSDEALAYRAISEALGEPGYKNWAYSKNHPRPSDDERQNANAIDQRLSLASVRSPH